LYILSWSVPVPLLINGQRGHRSLAIFGSKNFNLRTEPDRTKSSSTGKQDQKPWFCYHFPFFLAPCSMYHVCRRVSFPLRKRRYCCSFFCADLLERRKWSAQNISIWLHAASVWISRYLRNWFLENERPSNSQFLESRYLFFNKLNH
jgi:hypothetical protein